MSPFQSDIWTPMTSQRANAYGRVMQLLSASDSLETKHKDLIREAADALLFCRSIDESPEVMEALVSAIELGQRLADQNRWPAHRVEQLAEELSECGPGPAPVPLAA